MVGKPYLAGSRAYQTHHQAWHILSSDKHALYMRNIPKKKQSHQYGLSSDIWHTYISQMQTQLGCITRQTTLTFQQLLGAMIEDNISRVLSLVDSGSTGNRHVHHPLPHVQTTVLICVQLSGNLPNPHFLVGLRHLRL